MRLIYFKKPWKGQAGSALLGLIVTMVFLSALAAAMIAQTTTGSLGFVNENSSLRAYYLAESGFRYAAAKLKHKASLDDLHNHGSFSLGDKGSFTLEFTTYIFEVTGGIGTNELVTKASFGKAPLVTDMAGYVKVGNNPVQAFDAVAVDASPNDNVVRFTNNTQTWNVFVGEDVKLVVKSNGGAVSEGGDLNLQAGSSDAFPLYNGHFKADGKTYQYKKRETDKLAGITRVDSSTWVAPSLSNGDDIVLQAFAQLTSTGTYGEGDMAVSRKIVYNIPVSTSEKAEFHDTFEDKSNWEEESTTLGSHSTEIIAGVLKVTGTGSVGGADVGSLIKIDSSTVDAMLERAHASAGNYLSYDTQVKVGFDPSVPSTYMAGISFRQDAVAAGNSYGISFLKGGISDGIPDVLVPGNDWPMIVLWQHKTSASTKWLAYKYLIGRPVYFDTETAYGDWSKWIPAQCGVTETCLSSWPDCDEPPANYNGVLWHPTSTNRLDRNDHTNELSYYGQDSTDNYWTGTEANCGVLESPSIDLTVATSAFLSFWSWYRTENNQTYDKKFVQISTDNGTNWSDLIQLTTTNNNPMSTWQQILIDLSNPVNYTGYQYTKIRFKFDTCNCAANTGEGWYIDDVTVSGDFPVNEATLMVRVIEGATLKFTNGGATPIKDEDQVIQGTARGRVVGEPILESGDWATNDAAGIIVLNNVSGTFQGSQDLYVDGSVLARSSATDFFRSRDNYVKVFYGEADGYGTPNADPLDYEKHGILRGEVHWPPDEVDETDEDNDYFTLVQWDTVATDLDSSSPADEGIFGTGKELDAIIRLNALTTSTGIFTDTEIGLHTFGINSTSIYFDDFGLQIEVPTLEGFFPAIQQ